MTKAVSPLEITLPSWIDSVVDWGHRYRTDEDRMRLAIALSRQNVVERTGGPFGAGIFVEDTGEVVGIGVNSVERLHNATLHGEMVAYMVAQHRLQSFSLGVPGMPSHTLVSSCDPCAMCLGAVLWSGVQKIVTGAGRDDATALGFEEGPVFPESYTYLQDRGITIVRGVLRSEARDVLELYRQRGGKIYNP